MNQQELTTLELTVVREHVLCVTLNRPQAANAFNTVMSQELYRLFEQVAMHRENTRCIVLTGSGDRAFCAGGDLKERNGMSDDQWGRQHLVFERMVRAILDCPVPIIGAVNGAAYGGGCEIACLLDFIYVADHASFALPETGLGIIPGAGGTQTLARAIGERRAKEIILSGRSFTAAEALDWGLANAVLTRERLMSAVLKVAERIAGNAPVAVVQAKQSIHRGLQMSLSDGLAFEIEAYNRTVPTRDRREGILAFNEKRKPQFAGK